MSPSRADASESVCSLNFASRVNSVVPGGEKKEKTGDKGKTPTTPVMGDKKTAAPSAVPKKKNTLSNSGTMIKRT